jgi:hypothetical protein
VLRNNVPSLFRQVREDNEKRPSTIIGRLPGQEHNHEHMPQSLIITSDNFTIFEGTSEIQRMLIGRAVTGLDVR